MLAAERQQIIIEQLDRTGRVRVSELSRELGVSRMTIHRDLTQLAEQGILKKVFGGAVSATVEREDAGGCAMCGMRVRRRTAFVLNCRDGSQIKACCAHCGLILLAMRPETVSALAADFLHGRMINVRTAAFLVDSELTVCCTPTVLCFQGTAEAKRFKLGFGGQVLDVHGAQEYLRDSMMIG